MGSRAPGPVEPVAVAMPDGTFIVIHPFPREPAFAREIERAVHDLSASAAGASVSEGQLLISLRAALRQWYPRVEIQPRDALAGLIADERVWYVLRDGRVRPSSDRSDRVHEALPDARETSSRTASAAEGGGAALDLANPPGSSPAREAAAARQASTTALAEGSGATVSEDAPGDFDDADESEMTEGR